MSGKVETSKWENLKIEDLMRGATLVDVEQRCMSLCADYIGGSWATVTDPFKDLEVRRITGGLTNQLYYVALKDHIKSVVNHVYEDEPRKVTIKFFQKKHWRAVYESNERLSDTIISLIVSQLGIGPKAYGIFDDGIVQSYHKHKPFGNDCQKDDRLLRMALNHLARINLLQVPIPKKKGWFLGLIENFIDDAFNKYGVGDAIQEGKYEYLHKYDVRQEAAQLIQMINNMDFPLVLCHNDFRSSNILVTGDTGKEKLVICDLEYCCYGQRGHDLANFILEWNRAGLNTDWAKWQLPDNEVIEHYCRLYMESLEQVDPGYTSRPRNSFAEIVREAKIGMCEDLMFFTAFILQVHESVVQGMEFNIKENLNFVELNYKNYHTMKQRLIAEGIIPVSS